MKKTCLANSTCPMMRGYEVVGDWWSLLIVTHMMAGNRRFNEIQTGLGMAKNILAARLRKLVENGVIRRGEAEYELTDKGNDLFAAVTALRQWGERHCGAKGSRKPLLVEKRSGEAVGKIEVRGRGGKVLAPTDVEVVVR